MAHSNFQSKMTKEGCTPSNYPTALTYLSEVVPPVATALGAGGGRQGNMDRGFRTWLWVKLERGKENNSLQFNHQHANILHHLYQPFQPPALCPAPNQQWPPNLSLSNMPQSTGSRYCNTTATTGDSTLVGISAWNFAEFRNYSGSGPFSCWNFDRNFVFPM